MGELAEEERQFESLPEWVPTYLAAWGSVRPDRKAMSVEWAAGLAGVTPSAVRKQRIRSRKFKTLEYIARHGSGIFMTSFADAGIRGAAPAILQAFLRLVDDGNAQVVIQAMKWLRGLPDMLDVTSGGEPLGRSFEDALDRIYGNGDDDGTGDPDGPPGGEETTPDGAEPN